ncbi:winged helix-turn-helix domain-containing protein [Acidipropionibacterium jensenii]|nr:winged helix-turn-helix domain-containing protein [Acidipropionibacterium jensenii]MDN5977636.1 winged helix-turn-helix domain-containing protein [Acidipropionibacterium jensenii]MDN5996576.1 winged helix-turn-helix domain-containing protein [Acidipropionibacterium jensenii]MDN6426355.1 winged helix-turn-helix domain-containing protein [Acidipropionibacterium jensenii]MDN6441281.1 winged helix-turn-helix domain-containing protein [Acidipropionibacterium jensenii]MDN6480587.1 winged helix-tu
MRRDLVIDLPLRVERGGSRTLSVQLADQIRALISSGRVRPGDHLPSTRQAAARLGVSRGCVTSAYDQLQAEGYLVAAHGSGTSVNRRLDGLHAGTPSTVRTGTVGHGAEVPDRPHLLDLRPGQPDTSSLADSVWRGAWR